MQILSLEKALAPIKSGDHIHWPCVAAAPQLLIKALVEHAEKNNLNNIKVTHLYTEGYAEYADNPRFHLDSYFVGANVRKSTQSKRSDYIPCSLSDTPRIIAEGIRPVDVLLLMVSAPKSDGTVSLGTSVDCTLAALQQARYVVALINPRMPYCFGDAVISLNDIDACVECDEPLLEAEFPPLSEQDQKIGSYIAELIPDGATLQIGIGSIPNAVLNQLGNHKNLGIHSEMFSDGALPLIERGVINGSCKVTDPGKHVATFLKGTQKLYDYVNDNPNVLMQDVGYTNNPMVIAKNPNVVAINSALQIDITGQVCSDSIGTKIFSGSGGQLDFMLGAAWSKGGIPIIAMPSITNKGVSKIVPTLLPGAGVVTPRTCVHWVVTEQGRVNLFGKSLQERARLLCSIAHPSVREQLEKEIAAL